MNCTKVCINTYYLIVWIDRFMIDPSFFYSLNSILIFVLTKRKLLYNLIDYIDDNMYPMLIFKARGLYLLDFICFR